MLPRLRRPIPVAHGLPLHHQYKATGGGRVTTNERVIEDNRAIDLLNAGGVLNPDVTLDKLMDLSRELAEAGVISTAVGTYFVGAYYVYKYITR
jgi:hypothetical protein